MNKSYIFIIAHRAARRVHQPGDCYAVTFAAALRHQYKLQAEKQALQNPLYIAIAKENGINSAIASRLVETMKNGGRLNCCFDRDQIVRLARLCDIPVNFKRIESPFGGFPSVVAEFGY